MPEPGVVGERLRHERRVDALAQRDLLHHVPERHDVVGGGERVGVAQVDLLLAGRALVVAELHRDAHRLEHRDRVAPEVVADAVRDVVEVAALVDRHRRLPGRRAGRGTGRTRSRGGCRRRSPGRRPSASVRLRTWRGSAYDGVPSGQQDVAEHPGGARRLGAPRQDLEGPRVGLGEHVRLGDPGEALDGRPVEADPLVEGALELGRRDGDRLEEAEHVGEPQPHEADVALLEGAEHELLLLVHAGDRAGPVFPPCYGRRLRRRRPIDAWPICRYTSPTGTSARIDRAIRRVNGGRSCALSTAREHRCRTIPDVGHPLPPPGPRAPGVTHAHALAARTLSPVLAFVAALALVAVAILAGALTSAGHDSAGASWNKTNQAGASWNHKQRPRRRLVELTCGGRLSPGADRR